MGIIRSLSKIVLIGIAVVGLTITSARADILTFNYSATIFSSSLGAEQLSEDQAGVGITITGTFSYDIDAAPVDFDVDADFQKYDPALSAISVDFLFGANTSVEGSFLRILNDCCPDNLDEFFMIANTASGSEFTGSLEYAALELDIILKDTNKAVFSGLGLPTGFNLALFTSAVFQFVGEDAAENRDAFQATITSISAVSVVPIPAALPLFLTGLAGLALIRRRQRQT